MPPTADDTSIPDDAFLIRVLKAKHIVIKQGRERPTSDCLTDSNYENSCYISGECLVEEVFQLFPGMSVALFRAALVRNNGFVIERRAAEAPEGLSNPNSHVVTGPRTAIARGDYERAARTIVKDLSVQIMHPAS